MQKNIKKTTDFFSLYRSNQLRRHFLSGGIAIFVAFSVVSFSHGDIDTQGLMASVASLNDAPRSDADITMTRQDSAISITFGARATNVDQIEFSLLSDPTRLHSIITNNTDIHITGEKDTGAYHISIDMHGRDIAPGTRIAELIASIDPETPIAITDTEFVSGGQNYSLTNKGE